jgi:PIN domain
MTKTILLIDYENIQKFDLSIVPKKNIEIKIFIGQSQNKIPFELVQSTQRFGKAVEWIKIEGNGANALDFHIAFYLGKLIKSKSNISLVILSKDQGFDPLVRYIKNQNVFCERIQDLLELSKGKDPAIARNEELTLKIIENLSKIQKIKRPRNRKTLSQYIKSLLAQKQLSEKEINALVDGLFLQKKVSEANNRIAYNF